MAEEKIEPGDVVQLAPDTDNPNFAGCLMIVTEVKTWGLQGYVPTPTGDAYYRAAFGTFASIGKAKWTKE